MDQINRCMKTDEKLIHVFKDKICPESPYIPSFLSMRELKPLWEVYDRAILSVPKDERPEVIFIDGFGRWHERQAGLAVGFGVEREVRTIGVGKEYQPLRPDLGMFFFVVLDSTIFQELRSILLGTLEPWNLGTLERCHHSIDR